MKRIDQYTEYKYIYLDVNGDTSNPFPLWGVLVVMESIIVGSNICKRNDKISRDTSITHKI